MNRRRMITAALLAIGLVATGCGGEWVEENGAGGEIGQRRGALGSARPGLTRGSVGPRQGQHRPSAHGEPPASGVPAESDHVMAPRRPGTPRLPLGTAASTERTAEARRRAGCAPLSPAQEEDLQARGLQPPPCREEGAAGDDPPPAGDDEGRSGASSGDPHADDPLPPIRSKGGDRGDDPLPPIKDCPEEG